MMDGYHFIGLHEHEQVSLSSQSYLDTEFVIIFTRKVFICYFEKITMAKFHSKQLVKIMEVMNVVEAILTRYHSEGTPLHIIDGGSCRREY